MKRWILSKNIRETIDKYGNEGLFISRMQGIWTLSRMIWEKPF